MYNNQMDKSFILTVIDLNNKRYYVSCCGLEHTNEFIKFALSADYGFNMAEIILFLRDCELQDHKAFYQSGVCKDSIVRMFVKLRSGGSGINFN
jgi:hypothetical protein